LFDRPKPTAGCSANGRRKKKEEKEEEEKKKEKKLKKEKKKRKKLMLQRIILKSNSTELAKCYTSSIDLYGAQIWTRFETRIRHARKVFETWCWRTMEMMNCTDLERSSRLSCFSSEDGTGRVSLKRL
jgi:hypothetical protein